MNKYNSTKIIRSVRKSIPERNRVISVLYNDRQLKDLVSRTLIKLGCDRQDAKDYFVEALVNFMQACNKPEFEIKRSLPNYLIGTAKNIWLKEVTKSVKRRTIEDNIVLDPDQSIEIVLIESEKKKVLSQVLNRLDETCRKLLNLWAMQKKMKEIAKVLSYKSEGMARKKKHQCLKRLYSVIDSLPNIRQELSSI